MESVQSTCAREPLVDAIVRFLSHERDLNERDIRTSLHAAIDQAGPNSLQVLSTSLACAGNDWTYYPGDPLVRRIHHLLAPEVLRPEPFVVGGDHLKSIVGKPVVIIANHLSYSDANVLEFVFQRLDRRLADRLTAMAGPKVYSNVTRRFSSLCFGTIKTPQNTQVSSDEAAMGLRDVARAARRVIQLAHERLSMGDALLVFPEGSRSRTARMQPFLSGVARYLDPADTWVLPIGLTGTERLFPINGSSLTPVPIAVRIGEPIPAKALREQSRGNRQVLMNKIGSVVAQLLPDEYRGAYSGRPEP